MRSQGCVLPAAACPHSIHCAEEDLEKIKNEAWESAQLGGLCTAQLALEKPCGAVGTIP